MARLSTSRGAGTPLGAMRPGLAAGTGSAPQVPRGGQEYLRAGALLPYGVNYAAAVAVAPELARFGRLADVASITPVAGGNFVRLAHDGTRYHLFEYNGTDCRRYHSTDLVTWSGPTTVVAVANAACIKGCALASGGGVAVVAYTSSTLPSVLTATGTGAFTARATAGVGTGSMSNVAFDGTTWAVLYVATGPTETSARLAAASPDAAWTTAATTGSTDTTTHVSLDGSGSVWCAARTSDGSAVLRSSTDLVAWTSRSAPAGVAAGNNAWNMVQSSRVVWTGAGGAFVVPVINPLTGAIRLMRSTDAITWSLDSADVPGVVGAAWDTTCVAITTDRAGRVWLAVTPAPGSGGGSSAQVAYSTDHGATWTGARFTAQVVTVHGGSRHDAMSWANGELFLNQVTTAVRYRLAGATPAQLAGATPQWVGTPEAITFASGVPAEYRIR